jgi:uncharacterized phage protein (TIGR02218 family)
MLNLDPVLLSRLEQRSLTLCRCWLLRRTDGITLGFTEHTRSFRIDGIEYTPLNPIDAQQSDTYAQLTNSNTQLTVLYSEGRITESDVRAGLYDQARVREFIVDFEYLPTTLNANPAQHIDTSAQLVLAQITNNSGVTVSFEARSLSSLLDQQLGWTSSRTCRNEFGDALCAVPLAPIVKSVVVTERHDLLSFSVSDVGQGGSARFANGTIRFVEGDLQFIGERRIKRYEDFRVTLWQQLPFLPDAGNRLNLTPGCNKQLTARSFQVVVVAVENRRSFLVSESGQSDLTGGSLEFETGNPANIGRKQIAQYVDRVVTLTEDLPELPENGDNIMVTQLSSGEPSLSCENWLNQQRFNGEPYLVGRDSQLRSGI